MSLKELHLVVEKLGDETACCICTETFIDPRVLPCNHTFCLKCLTGSIRAVEREPEGRGRQLQRELEHANRPTCPVCRQGFTIPDQGLTDLPKNFFMMRLIDIMQVSKSISAEGAEALCDACTESADLNSAFVSSRAETYCIECRQKLCEECTVHHKKNKMTKLHHVVPHGTEITVDPLDDAVLRLCEQHWIEYLIYCEDCREAVCPLCFVEKHGLHRGKDANKLIKYFRQQVDSQLSDLSEFILQSEKKQEMVQEKLELFSETAELVKETVFKGGQEEKFKIDKVVKSVHQAVNSVKEQGLKDIAAVEEGLGLHIDDLKGYLEYCSKIKSLVTINDVSETLRNISETANQMRKEHQLQIDRPIPKPELGELGSWFDNLRRVTGNLDIYCDSPVLLQRFRTRAVSRDSEPICGMTLLGNELSVMHSNSSRVTVYNAKTISFHHEYTVRAVHNPVDLTSCKKYKCLYILDEQRLNESYRILKVNEHREMSCSWDVGHSFGSLSVSSCGNVILAIEKKFHLKEYTADGDLLREIVHDLSPVNDIRNAVQLSEDLFMTFSYSDRNDKHSLCLLDMSDGTILKERSDLRIKVPVCLVLDGAQNILVVDQSRKRVVVLCGSSLRFKRELLTVEHGLEFPQKILLDEFLGRLFLIDDFTQILAFDVRRASARDLVCSCCSE